MTSVLSLISHLLAILTDTEKYQRQMIVNSYFVVVVIVAAAGDVCVFVCVCLCV